ncbi:MAG: Trypsin, partial [Myxococcaceae bacterium]|nr:Trypsin [Myxococcaceae bacterium]
MRRLVLASAALLTAIVGCVSRKEEAAPPVAPSGESAQAIITPQRPTKAKQYTEAVLVQVNNPPDNDYCSGVLIAPKVILTAAHCVAFVNGGNW